MNRTWGAVASALLAAVVFAGCSKVATGPVTGKGNPWTEPGVLRIGENASAPTLVPEFGTSQVPIDVSMFVFSYAVRYNQKAQPVPDALSEVPTVANGDVSKDGLTLKYKLRHNIKWSDGQPLTCRDLKFTWQVIMNPHNNVNTTDGFRDIKSIDCSNPYVAVIHMKKLYAPFLQQLWGVNGNAPILPEHILAKYNDDKGSMNTAPFNSMPIGSGPFKVVEWQRGSEILMEPNPYFYGGLPKLHEVQIRTYPDENTMETELQTHGIDMLAHGSGLNWPRYKALADNPKNGLKAIRVDSFAFDHIDFNLKNPILSDLQVRRALAYDIDRRSIIQKVMHGSAILAYTDQQPLYSWAYTNDIVHYPYDPAKARALLRADGWRTGPGGIRVKDGRPLEFNLSTPTESTYGKAIQEILQRQWRLIGVKADIKNVTTPSFFANGKNGILEGGHYDVAIYGWFSAADPDDSAIYSGKNLAPAGQDDLFWNDPIVNAAEDKALGTIDQAARKKQYDIIQQQLALQVPTIILYFLREPYVYNTDLHGFKPSPVISPFWDPQEYSI